MCAKGWARLRRDLLELGRSNDRKGLTIRRLFHLPACLRISGVSGPRHWLPRGACRISTGVRRTAIRSTDPLVDAIEHRELEKTVCCLWHSLILNRASHSRSIARTLLLTNSQRSPSSPVRSFHAQVESPSSEPNRNPSASSIKNTRSSSADHSVPLPTTLSDLTDFRRHPPAIAPPLPRRLESQRVGTDTRRRFAGSSRPRRESFQSAGSFARTNMHSLDPLMLFGRTR